MIKDANDSTEFTTNVIRFIGEDKTVISESNHESNHIVMMFREDVDDVINELCNLIRRRFYDGSKVSMWFKKYPKRHRLRERAWRKMRYCYD